MQNQTETGPKITVNMLGDFSITIDGSHTAGINGRAKRVWMLIQFLIANRNKNVSVEKLTEFLWDADECGDPMNALKNLAYRARKSLRELAGNGELEFIKFTGNTYVWNNDYDCIVDTEQLEENWKLVKDSTKPDEARIRSCENAVALYRGGFLSNAAYRTWTISMDAWYSTLYNDCVQNGCRILIQYGRYDEVIRICETALLHLPLEEYIHKTLLYAYVHTNRFNNALKHYNNTVKLFRRELDFDVSSSLQPLYNQIVNHINHMEDSLSVIEGDLQESCDAKGAYFCDYDVFRSIYQVQSRMAPRSGFHVCVSLIAISGLNGETPETGIAETAMESLKEAICTSLRKEDIFAAYNSTRFIVMFTLKYYKTAKIVINRIAYKFHLLYGKDNIKMAIQSNALNAVP